MTAVVPSNEHSPSLPKPANSFNNGDVDRKRDVFATMRVNSTLEAGKLAIEPPSWLVPIAEQSRTLLGQSQALEPAKQRATTRPELNRETLSPILRGLVDAVGTALANSNIDKPRALHDVSTSKELSGYLAPVTSDDPTSSL